MVNKIGCMEWNSVPEGGRSLGYVIIIMIYLYEKELKLLSKNLLALTKAPITDLRTLLVGAHVTAAMVGTNPGDLCKRCAMHAPFLPVPAPGNVPQFSATRLRVASLWVSSRPD